MSIEEMLPGEIISVSCSIKSDRFDDLYVIMSSGTCVHRIRQAE